MESHLKAVSAKCLSNMVCVSRVAPLILKQISNVYLQIQNEQLSYFVLVLMRRLAKVLNMIISVV